MSRVVVAASQLKPSLACPSVAERMAATTKPISPCGSSSNARLTNDASAGAANCGQISPILGKITRAPITGTIHNNGPMKERPAHSSAILRALRSSGTL